MATSSSAARASSDRYPAMSSSRSRAATRLRARRDAGHRKTGAAARRGRPCWPWTRSSVRPAEVRIPRRRSPAEAVVPVTVLVPGAAPDGLGPEACPAAGTVLVDRPAIPVGPGCRQQSGDIQSQAPPRPSRPAPDLRKRLRRIDRDPLRFPETEAAGTGPKDAGPEAALEPQAAPSPDSVAAAVMRRRRTRHRGRALAGCPSPTPRSRRCLTPCLQRQASRLAPTRPRRRLGSRPCSARRRPAGAAAAEHRRLRRSSH